MIILVDMDNTLVDFDKGLLKVWRNMYPHEFYVPLGKRTTFHPHADYPERLQSKIQDVCHSEGFVRDLPPMPGGIEAVYEMVNSGHDVRFCTSYLLTYDYCVLEKYQWIEKHFDASYVDKIILTRDKTLIRGDILIDDKPNITGIQDPTWEHILYDRPFNRKVTTKRRLNWRNWHDI
jgi:5'-nucleotidase